MTTLTVALTEQLMDRLKALAREAGISPEELVRAILEVWLSGPKKDFVQAARYVLEKNAELYRRLS